VQISRSVKMLGMKDTYLVKNGAGLRSVITLTLERLGSNVRVSLPACLLEVETARIAFENLAWTINGAGVTGAESFTATPRRLASAVYSMRVGNGAWDGKRNNNARPSGFRFEVIAGRHGEAGEASAEFVGGESSSGGNSRAAWRAAGFESVRACEAAKHPKRD